MPELPSGTVTFLFTDIEGSTHLWETQPEAMQHALARHETLLRAAIARHQGQIFKEMGDALFAVFTSAPAALDAAIAAQRAMQDEDWPSALGPLRVRIALHTGIAEPRGGDYYGATLNRLARLLAAGHGGQTLLSQPTYELVRDHRPRDVT